MNDFIDILIRIVFIGVGATLCMDLWARIQRVLWGITSLDYALVGRWLGWIARGRFYHTTILTSGRITGEHIIGWVAHYLIGVMLAALLTIVVGSKWLYQPTLIPALITGIVSVVAPFFVMQPAFGFGIAAAKTPAPNIARIRSMITHLVFGLGIYLAAKVSLWLLG
ncbi:DUF2938 domain-containing protein [Pragia fontium]|uniref:DUF2938 domain-containing protein n=2 Tax=Pragia fontium TaxID=82985 RepID=A0AAJ4W7X3_9GAMM|nr:DUF2938 domain-containing protein [Pragia fontium]SFC06405.1 Protein of unknown function [Pragia fontium DSM 5563 = ATCC 49100]SUB81513.1 Protein of uncharacterised function (DUF2938) [Pragia fontium]VEJ53889.1 Protein of uncharacterised function (DUF2938) [Pragia fontium]